MTTASLFDQTTAERFQRFHEGNPQVYEALRRLALHAKARGKRIGIRLAWEKLRWELTVEVNATEEGPKLQDHFTSFYARMLNRDPALEGYFETRGRRQEAPDARP